MKTIHWLAAVAAGLLPVGASAQMSDAAYCQALTQKYQAYVANISGGRARPDTVDGSLAIEQCKAGNTAAGIPVLERRLRDAKVDLPSRG